MTYGVLTRHFEGATVDAAVHPLSDRQLVDELTQAALAYLGVDHAAPVARGTRRKERR